MCLSNVTSKLDFNSLLIYEKNPQQRPLNFHASFESVLNLKSLWRKQDKIYKQSNLYKNPMSLQK